MKQELLLVSIICISGQPQIQAIQANQPAPIQQPQQTSEEQAARPLIPCRSFYFTRHGVTQWNLDNKQQGQTDIPLHEQGRKEIEALRAVCDTLPITHFWSSSLSRAHETMKILNKSKKLPEAIHDDLQEQGKGNLEGITEKEWRKLDRGTIKAAMEDKNKFKIRTLRIMQHILADDGTPCIVAHSNNLRCIAQLAGVSIKRISHNVIWHFEAPTAQDSAWRITEFKLPKSPEPVNMGENS